MTIEPDRPVESPFWFQECFIMPMPIGVTASNLRELLHALKEVDEAVLSYHLWQSRLAIAHPALEYPNDFAKWSATALQESILAEKFSAFSPFGFEDMEEIREALVEVLEEYLWDFPSSPWVRPGYEFHFCEASTVVFRSGIVAGTLGELHSGLERVGLDAVYYHCLDARWRLRSEKMDDVSFWIETNYGLPELVSAVRDIDVYFYTFEEIRNEVLDLMSPYLEGSYGRTE